MYLITSYRAITSHIQTSGYTIVLGSDRTAVNKVGITCRESVFYTVRLYFINESPFIISLQMIMTLGMFLSSKERKMSRLVWEQDPEDEKAVYEPHLFLQGCVIVSV